MNSSTKIPIAREGLKLIFALALLTIVLFLVKTAVTGFFLLAVTLFVAFFFRDPRREVPLEEKAVVAPADGKVVAIRDIHEQDYLRQDVKQISIFLSIFDVHVNRAPISGVVESVKYNPGKFHIAALDKASLENEQTSMTIAGENCRILVKQIAGIIARRVICYLRPGDVIKKGDRYGLICFGSRVDIFLPADSEIKVAKGDRVKGARDIIATLG